MSLHPEKDKSSLPSSIRLWSMGMVSYRKAYAVQHRLLEDRRRGAIPNTLLSLEHPCVITLGKKYKGPLCLQEDLNGIPIVSVERGGEATLHAPGQYILYPIFSFSQWGAVDIIRLIEECMISFLSQFNIDAFREPLHTGVWVHTQGEKKKISSIGISLRSFFSFHGVSLNVSNELGLFSMIEPCGIDASSMTSMEEILGPLDKKEVQWSLEQFFCRFFSSYVDS